MNKDSVFEVWPGPMEGVGSNEFARAASDLHLTDRWMTPFIRVTGTPPSNSKLCKQIAAYLDSRLPVTVQIMGTDPELLGMCGRKLLEIPGVSGINLNAGCPSSRVVKHGSGGGMLKPPEKLAGFCKILASFLPPGKLSVKLRSGFENSDDMKKFLPELCESGVISKIFFHYRTVKEAYSPSALPFREKRICQAVKLCGNIPLIANGDIASVEEAVNILKTTGASGVMIARPWMRDPFLLRRFKEKTLSPDEGREKFFQTIRDEGIHGGALIETAKMLWGANSPRFKEILESELQAK